MPLALEIMSTSNTTMSFIFRFIFSLSCQSSPVRNSTRTEIQTTSAHVFFFYYALFRLFIYCIWLFSIKVSVHRHRSSCMLHVYCQHLQWLRTFAHFPCVWLWKSKTKRSRVKKKGNEKKKIKGKEIQKNITFDSILRDITKNAIFAQQKPVSVLPHTSVAVNIIFLLSIAFSNAKHT